MTAGAIVFLKVVVAAALIVSGAVLAIWGLIKGTQGLIWALGGFGRGLAFLVGHTLHFIRSMIADAFRTVGALLTALVLIPLAVLNLLFFRWDMFKHYGRALEDEAISFGLGVYRVAFGNPLHFIGMGLITDGVERRIPEVVARAPRTGGSSVRDGKFDGYKVTGVLPAGGSGARLFLAKPRAEKTQQFRDAGFGDPGTVVIKAFSLQTGSTMPQIVRESRALEAARKTGLVLDHELNEKNFYYVMPYVPGDSLDLVCERMHGSASPAGLADRQLRVALGYVGDLLYTLDAFHGQGLWHKDIKPSNLIVSDGRAHLVDLGLVTPLASAMTLTTHGTEYFRDPEMVRQALRGVKVHEVNGVKFDIYSTGAVLFALVENSFPAQGSLSRLSKRCPEVVQWIVRRAMADVDGRYEDAREMLADIRTVLAANDPWKVRPADLPSINGRRDFDLPRADLRAGFGARATTAAHRTSAKGPRPAGTNKAGKTRRRSTGRTIAASFIGMFFLAGLAGLGILAIEEGHMVAQGHGATTVTFQSDPAAWCVEDSGDRVLVQSGELELPTTWKGLAKAAANSHTETSHRGGATHHDDAPTSDEDLAQREDERLEALRNQWSRQLDQELDALCECAPRFGSDESAPRTVLVLRDLSPTTDRAYVDALQLELERRDLIVLGNASDDIGDERDILYEAGARMAVGVSDPTDAEALLRLESFLAENVGLDALIWIAEGEEPDTLAYHFVRPRQNGELRETFALSAGE